MARPLRIEFPGAFHHVMARGNARQSVFRDVQDRQAFLAGLKRETLQPTLSRGMREINGIYTPS